MDAVRFGRALGFGARQAAKTVAKAVDAARAENPSKPAATTPSAPMPSPTEPAVPVSSAAPSRSPVAVLNPPRTTSLGPRAAAPGMAADRAAQTAPRTVAQARGVQVGLNRFRDSAVEPVVRLSGVLWLEVMGVFFGIFAISTAIAVWRLRAEWRAAIAHPAAHGSLLAAAAVSALFAYFCISSFVRARRRERRRG